MVAAMMRPNLLIIGANGQLGRSLQKVITQYPTLKATFADRTTIDLAQPEQIEEYFTHHCYDYIINSAAYTAVDLAEDEPELAEQINHHAVAQLAQIAKQNDTALFHISTDYVFAGTQCTPYLESDPTAPQGVYGASKLRGEEALFAQAPQGAIIRTSWLYSEFGNNFVKTMLRLGKEREQLNVVYDQIGSPTYATDLAHAVLTILSSGQLHQPQTTAEIYHYANQGIASWYDFAQAIMALSETECKICPVTSQQYPTKAKRPHYSVLSTEKIKQKFNLTVPYWRGSLRNCLNELASVLVQWE